VRDLLKNSLYYKSTRRKISLINVINILQDMSITIGAKEIQEERYIYWAIKNPIEQTD